MPSAPSKSLSSADGGALNLYRQYLKKYSKEQQQQPTTHQSAKTSSGDKKSKKEKFEFPLNSPRSYGLRNLQPLFDCEISRRPLLPHLPDETGESTVVVMLTIPMASVNSFSVHGQSKTSKNFLVDGNGQKFGLSFGLVLSWLLTLTPKNSSPDAEPIGNSFIKPESDKAPFSLQGLQLATRNNLTNLDIFISPLKNSESENSEKNSKKSKKRKNHSEFDEFVTRVRRFLASTKLNKVAEWAWKEHNPIDALLSETDHQLCDKPLGHFLQLNGDPKAARRVLQIPASFEWAQVASQNEASNVANYKFTKNELLFENCFGLVLGDSFAMGFPILEMIIKASFYCLDITGIKLCWLTKEEYNTVTISQTFNASESQLVPCLALCVRGANAIQNWQTIVGPRNNKVAQYTDPASLSAIYGAEVIEQHLNLRNAASPESCIFYSPRSCERSYEMLMQFFGGFITDKDLESIEAGKMSRESVNQSRCFMLTATAQQPLMIVLSPRLPVRFLSDCINTIQTYGFQIETVQRYKLNQKQLKFIDEGNYSYFLTPNES